MELQDFVMKSVVSQLRFAVVTPSLIDKRGELISELLKEHGLTEWGLSDEVVDVFSNDRTTYLRVGSREVVATFENIEEVDDVREQTRGLFDQVLPALNVDEVRQVGVRSMWIAAADSFPELRDWLIERVSAGSRTLFPPVGADPSDVGWVFEFHDKDPKHNLRIGPMTAEQAMERVFRDQNPENYPAQFLFLDVDRLYNEDVLPTDKALERWDATFRRNLEISEKLARVLTAPP